MELASKYGLHYNPHFSVSLFDQFVCANVV